MELELKEALYSIQEHIEKGKPLSGRVKTIAIAGYEAINTTKRKAPSNCSSCPILYTILRNWYKNNPKPKAGVNELSYKELRDMAKEKGYKGLKPSKEFLIEYLKQ